MVHSTCKSPTLLLQCLVLFTPPRRTTCLWRSLLFQQICSLALFSESPRFSPRTKNSTQCLPTGWECTALLWPTNCAIILYGPFPWPSWEKPSKSVEYVYSQPLSCDWYSNSHKGENALPVKYRGESTPQIVGSALTSCSFGKIKVLLKLLTLEKKYNPTFPEKGKQSESYISVAWSVPSCGFTRGWVGDLTT